jgi:hypothetical protein
MRKNKIVSPFLALCGSVFLTAKAWAEPAQMDLPIPLPQPDGGPSDLATWLPQVLNLAIGLAALVCVAVLIGSGYMYITAAGDETKVEKATKSLTYAIIGLVICFISVILVEFVLKNVLAPGA